MNTYALLTVVLLTITLIAVVLGIATALRRFMRATWERRRAARAALLRPALLALAAGDDDPEVREQLAAPDRVLARAVRDVLPRVRGEARTRLVAIVEERGLVDRLVRRTRRPGAVGRANAAETLGWMGIARTLPALARLLDDHNAEVVPVAGRALCRMGDPAAVPFLLAALESGRHITPGQVAAALSNLGGDVAARLADNVAHANDDIRLVAVEVLGLVGTAGVIDPLSGALDDAQPAVRVAAAHALGRIGGPRAVEPLLASLHNPDANVRTAAATALGRIGDPAAIDGLLTAVHDPVLDVARAASYALTQTGAEGRAALERPAAALPVAAEALVVAIMNLEPRLRVGISSLAMPAEVI